MTIHQIVGVPWTVALLATLILSPIVVAETHGSGGPQGAPQKVPDYRYQDIVKYSSNAESAAPGASPPSAGAKTAPARIEKISTPMLVTKTEAARVLSALEAASEERVKEAYAKLLLDLSHTLARRSSTQAEKTAALQAFLTMRKHRSRQREAIRLVVTSESSVSFLNFSTLLYALTRG